MKPYFTKVLYEGPQSKNDLSFKYYQSNRMIMGKPMKDHLRFAAAYWHTMTFMGLDPFGKPVFDRPWDVHDAIQTAENRVHVFFEFLESLGLEYFCFHDRDIAPEQATLAETNQVLDHVVQCIKKEMERTGIKCLWATTNAFSHPRFVHGAATSPNPDVFAYAASQVKKAMDIAHELHAEGYVFWGGREGYETLLNTDTKQEQVHLAKFLTMAVDYKKSIGFKGQLYIEPKPKEPTKHQYDFDSASVIGFLKTYNLDQDYKLNIETNHATLAGHTIQHELRVARDAGLLGSVDANQGDLLLGWDTDQFPTNIYDTSLMMYEILKAGGLQTGGLNFDAKLRRGSIDVIDLQYAHIAGMDAFARGLIVASELIKDHVFESFIEKRYASWNTGIGKQIMEGKIGFSELETYVLNKPQIEPNQSARQELLESILNQYMLESK